METLHAILDFPAVKWLLLAFAFVMPAASLLTWLERRQSAMMQDRLGPNRANIGRFRAWGILHFIADAIKMISKEDFVPKHVHKGLYSLAPILAGRGYAADTVGAILHGNWIRRLNEIWS